MSSINQAMEMLLTMGRFGIEVNLGIFQPILRDRDHILVSPTLTATSQRSKDAHDENLQCPCLG